jgi:hypothetical protein
MALFSWLCVFLCLKRAANALVFLTPMSDEAPVTSAKAAVAGFDAVLINLLLSVLFASHHVEGS